jgi:hypothetical protein
MQTRDEAQRRHHQQKKAANEIKHILCMTEQLQRSHNFDPSTYQTGLLYQSSKTELSS